MLLEEALALGALGTAYQRERPADHVRRHPVPHRPVVVREILLGDADIDPVDTIRMGQADAAGARKPSAPYGGSARLYRKSSGPSKSRASSAMANRSVMPAI